MSTKYPTHAHTRGTTFSRAALVALPGGTWTPTSVIQTPAGQQIQVLDCNFAALPAPDADGNTHSLSVLATAAETAAWPLGNVMWVTTFADASATPVIVPAVTRVVQVGQYTAPTADADNPLAVITDAMAPVLRGEKGDPGDTGTGGPGAVTSVAGRTGDVVLAKADVGLGNVNNTADADKPVSTAQAAADTAVLNAAAADATAKANAAQAASDPAGTAASAVSSHASATDPHGDRAFATAADTAILAAANAHADALVVGLWDDRGNHDASANTWPTGGGSGTAGAILKGDIWRISVAGTLGGVAVNVGDTIRALVDAPGSTTANWAQGEANLGYVPENAATKDASGGYAGLSGYWIKLKNAAGAVTSLLASAATTARTWTFPDKDGTVAMLSDITGTNSGTNTGDETGARVATLLHAASAKTTLVDADEVAGTDSAASWGLIRTTWAQVWTYIKSKADAVYAPKGAITGSGLTMATGKLLGRGTASTGAIEEITLGTNLSLSGTTLNATGSGGSSNTRWLGAGELIPRVTNGAGIDGEELATNKINLDYLAFDAGTAEYAQASFDWPSGYTTLTAKLFWTAASGSGAVVWGAQARCYADDDALDQAQGTAQTVTDTLLAASDTHISGATSSITPGGTVAAGNLTVVQVYRGATNGSDTLAVDARLIGVLLTFA